MNKKRLTVLALMMALMMVLSTFMLVACDKDVTDPDDETKTTISATEGLLISNGDFKVTKSSDTTYPLSPESWSGAAMYSSGSYPKGVIAGVVSLEEEFYNENKSTWNDNDSALYNELKKHYSDEEGAVNNALMIYMPKESTDDKDYGPTAYGYTSSTFKLASNKFYKLSVDVLTKDIAGSELKDGTPEPGARIYISSAAYAEFANIDTKGVWETYTFYFESAVSSDTSLSVQLGLGKYSKEYTVGLTSGYAFFDNLTLEEVDEEVYSDNKDNYTLDNEEYRKNNQVHTLKVNNGHFDFGTTSISATAAASNWKVVTGDSAPTGLGKNGIIDVTTFADNCSAYANSYYVSTNEEAGDEATATLQYPATRLTMTDGAADIIGNFDDNRIGNTVYMLSQQRMTAQGLQASKPIVIEKGKYYAISVSVYTYDIHGAGVTLTLSGEGKDISIKGISENKSDDKFNAGLPCTETIDLAKGTNGGWTTYTFYIEGNQYKDYSYTMTLWLGTGSPSDNTSYTYKNWESTSKFREQTTYYANGTFSTGWAFFDEVTLNEIVEGDFTSASATVGTETPDGIETLGEDLKVSLHTENLFASTSISADFVERTTGANDYEGTTLGTPNGFSIAGLLEDVAEDKTLPYIDVTAGVVSIAKDADFSEFGIDNPGTPYENIPSELALMIKANSNSYFYYDTDLIKIAKNKAYRISFWVKTVDTQSTAGVHAFILNKDEEQLASFATINTETKVDDETTSVWKEYSFYILGHESEDKDITIRIAFGTGTKWSSSTLADGVAFIANMSMTAIKHDDYNNASTSSATVKSISLSEEKSITTSFSNGNFNSIDVSETEGLEDTDGILKNHNKAGAPSKWTLSDKTCKENGDDDEDAVVNTNKTYYDDPNLVAGVIKLEQEDKAFYHSNQIANLFPNDYSAFDTLYGDAESETYFENVDRIGAPYVLALAGLNGNKYSRRFTSNTFSLTAGNNYELKVWVKTIGTATYSIYLTGGTSGNTYFDQATNFVATSTDGDWTCYTFYIEVGLTSVSSLKLSLGIGYDKSISGDLSAEGHSEFSSGIVLFDSVTLTSTTTEEEFDAITADTIDHNTERKISYLSDGFDSASETVEAHTELTSPNGWKGSVGTDQSASNTVSGVVYVNQDKAEIPTHTIDSADKDDPNFAEIIAEMGQTVSLFGKTYKVSDYDIKQTEIDEAEAKYEGKSNDEIKLILQKTKMYADMKANYISVSELTSTTDKDGNNIADILGNNFLVINNTKASAYTYTSSAYGLNAESYYRVSVWVRTYNVTGAGASIEFYLGSANEKDKPFIFKGIGTKDGENGTTAWTQYTFYVKTLEEKVTSSTIKLSLGEYDADNKDLLATGYAMFDAIEFEIIDETTYDSAVAGDYIAKREVAESSQAGNVEESEEEETTTPDNKFDLESLWWMIPSILLAVATIAVIIVYVVKKYRKPERAKVNENIHNEAINEKRSKYEDYNE